MFQNILNAEFLLHLFNVKFSETKIPDLFNKKSTIYKSIFQKTRIVFYAISKDIHQDFDIQSISIKRSSI